MPTRKWFPAKVDVSIPIIDVVERPIHAKINMHPTGIGFVPTRPVVNLKVVDHDTGAELYNFPPGITVKVGYDPSDVADAGGDETKLKLGYWDGKKWTVCTAATHKFILVPDPGNPGTGWGIFEVDHWDDPTISWGT